MQNPLTDKEIDGIKHMFEQHKRANPNDEDTTISLIAEMMFDEVVRLREEKRMPDSQSREDYKFEIKATLFRFKFLLIRARGHHGRDFIRGLPQGKLLDALDANRETGFIDDSLSAQSD